MSAGHCPPLAAEIGYILWAMPTLRYKIFAAIEFRESSNRNLRLRPISGYSCYWIAFFTICPICLSRKKSIGFRGLTERKKWHTSCFCKPF